MEMMKMIVDLVLHAIVENEHNSLKETIKLQIC